MTLRAVMLGLGNQASSNPGCQFGMRPHGALRLLQRIGGANKATGTIFMENFRCIGVRRA